jgi:hypothetical protein
MFKRICFNIKNQIIANWISIALSLYVIFKERVVFMKPSPELFVLILILGVAITATIFSIHSYIRSGKYIKERKDILDNILLLLNSLSITDDNFLKINTRLSSVEKKDFSWEQILRQNLNLPKENT